MASSVLEQMRLAHEDIEVLEEGVMEVLQKKARRTRDRVENEHKVAAYLDEAQKLARELGELEADVDGIRADELAAMSGDGKFDAFYSRLRSLREYHAKFQQDSPTGSSAIERVHPSVTFSGEEGHGRYLDLHAFHGRFLNIKGHEEDRWDYLTFLSQFMNLDDTVDRKIKSKAPYRQYVGDLLRYLLSFHKRSQPLVDLSDAISAARERFLKDWEQGTLPWWKGHVGDGFGAAAASSEPAVDLDSAHSVADLEAYGLDALKVALANRGLKCGGSLTDRAKRLFVVKGLDPKDYPKKLLAKGAVPALSSTSAGGAAAAAAPASKSETGAAAHAGAGGGSAGSVPVPAFAEGLPGVEGLSGMQLVAWLEVLVMRMSDILEDVLSETRTRVERKQTRTYEELEAEHEEEAKEGSGDDDSLSDDSDEEKPIYNPKKLPLGWDGKPIPYWLYKLHGLNKEYVCEICGNESYMGRRDFDRHFQEWRHASGMRKLGIPNTKHFHDITLIEDAVSLHAKLKDTAKADTWKPEDEEEFEDTEGNVLSRKEYEELARQGML